MDKAVEKFRTLHTDSEGRTLIYYYPVTPMTTIIMENTIEILGVQNENMVHQSGEALWGAIGMESEMEMIEQAVFHSYEEDYHRQPVGIMFILDEGPKDPETEIPYNITYTICTFDDSISHTYDNYPYIHPASSAKWGELRFEIRDLILLHLHK